MDFKKQVDKTMHSVQKGVEVARTQRSAYKIRKMFATTDAPLII